MNPFRFLTAAAVSVTLLGCATTSDNSAARARTSQLREGMSQGQVKALFGQPSKVDHDDGRHYGGYIPYYGWRRGSYGDEELTWEYNSPKMEIKFRRSGSGGWVVKEWDID